MIFDNLLWAREYRLMMLFTRTRSMNTNPNRNLIANGKSCALFIASRNRRKRNYGGTIKTRAIFVLALAKLSIYLLCLLEQVSLCAPADTARGEEKPIHKDSFAVVIGIVCEQAMPLVFLLATAVVIAPLCLD